MSDTYRPYSAIATRCFQPRRGILCGERTCSPVCCALCAACNLEGIVPIGLIGSLTNDKLNPKDADLLITIHDGTLVPPAMLGHKLQGSQQRNCGEVFLCVEERMIRDAPVRGKIAGPRPPALPCTALEFAAVHSRRSPDHHLNPLR